VYLDVSACYEYIDHDPLRNELVARCMNQKAAGSIIELLSELMKSPRGLPQMHWASDRLADAYLDIVVRRLGHSGIDCVRYVDDFKGSYSPGVSAGGSQAPVVKSWWSASSLSSPHFVAVSR
jgi:predicted GNAT superfamily acetyltransferase